MENAAGTSPPDAHAVWTRALERVRGQVPESSYRMWFADVRAQELAGGVLELAAPSDYVKTWLASRHMDLLTRSVSEAYGGSLGIRLVTLVGYDAQPDQGPPASEAPSPLDDPAAPPEEPAPQLKGRYTFDSFVRGPSNQFALAAAMAVAEAPPSKVYNPLFIYGGVGLGKTHLLHAIAQHRSKLDPSTRAKYVTSEAFVTEFIRAVRERQGYQFQRRYRDVDILLVDDIQFLARAEETQTEFFHTFNELHDAQRQIVIASDHPPQELGGIEERLRTRFRWGLLVDIQPPDLETRIAILQLKAMRDGLVVPDDVLHFIAEKFESDIRELEGALLRVTAAASLFRVPITLAHAERVLEDMLPPIAQEVSAATILAETARYFGLRTEDLVSKSRSRPLTTARHIAMYLLRELSGQSLIKIGDLFERDHTTALHGIKKIESQLPVRGPLYRQVQELTKTIKASSRGVR